MTFDIPYSMNQVDDDDTELEEIRKKKLQELMNMNMNMSKGIGNASGNAKGSMVIPSAPIEVTDESFREIASKSDLLVLDCWAPWCMPCRMLAPTIDELARDYAGKVVFGKLNTDQNQFTAREFSIFSIPTVLFFKNGKLVDKVVGALPKQAFEEKIRQWT